MQYKIKRGKRDKDKLILKLDSANKGCKIQFKNYALDN